VQTACQVSYKKSGAKIFSAFSKRLDGSESVVRFAEMKFRQKEMAK
jgi:hypothetical protein